jgi:vacuolar-type H+-ATPase catalytic subunit A/Vma1
MGDYMESVNQKLRDISDEILEEKNDQEYSDFIQSKLHEFYMQELTAQCYDNDAEFYGEVI